MSKYWSFSNDLGMLIGVLLALAFPIGVPSTYASDTITVTAGESFQPLSSEPVLIYETYVSLLGPSNTTKVVVSGGGEVEISLPESSKKPGVHNITIGIPKIEELMSSLLSATLLEGEGQEVLDQSNALQVISDSTYSTFTVYLSGYRDKLGRYIPTDTPLVLSEENIGSRLLMDKLQNRELPEKLVSLHNIEKYLMSLVSGL